ncbi:hypothetical protein ACU4HD_44025 [Cupriavidus basilensis]
MDNPRGNRALTTLPDRSMHRATTQKGWRWRTPIRWAGSRAIPAVLFDLLTSTTDAARPCHPL